MPIPQLSVIIPVIDEAARLPVLLHALREQQAADLEILVADGGSTDASCEIAITHGARLIRSTRGRACQMNAAARAATGEFLLFLHADSRMDDPELLAHALGALKEEIRGSGSDRIAGHFRLNFDRRDDSHPLAWRYVEEKTAFNRANTTNGDQGLLLTKRYFDSLSGFDEDLPFLEDQRLAERIRASGLWITLPGLLHSSARRFEQAGFHNQYTLMAFIMAMHAAGMRAFFERSPGLYRAQAETGRLLLIPYFRLARQLLHERSFRERVACWMRVGRLGRQHWWQLFYFWDVLLRPLLGPGRYPFMRGYERIIEPWTANRLCDAIAALVLWLHFQLVLVPWFSLKEHRLMQEPSS